MDIVHRKANMMPQTVSFDIDGGKSAKVSSSLYMIGKYLFTILQDWSVRYKPIHLYICIDIRM